jgi:hypothetical protein
MPDRIDKFPLVLADGQLMDALQGVASFLLISYVHIFHWFLNLTSSFTTYVPNKNSY